MFYSNLNFWEKLNIWSESSQKIQYITAKKLIFYLPGSHTSALNFGMYNVGALITLTEISFEKIGMVTLFNLI